MAIAQAAAKEAQRNAQSRPSAQAPPPPQTDAKPATDVLAGAMARAASQSTIHPLDTMKVRMQNRQANATLIRLGGARLATGSARAGSVSGAAPPMHRRAHEILGLYKGVGGAATAAGTIIGTYFLFYTNAKQLLRQHTEMNEGAIAFVAGAAAAAGSCVVKMPMAVCIRSVQAGVYQNSLEAVRTITKAAGIRGLFTGFAPTLLEDVPDSAIKFAAYESLRSLHGRVTAGRKATTVEDLLMGGLAGSLAAALTTPLDVVKTVMMCSASQRPTVVGATRAILAERKGVAPFFRGVGPRALSNGLNSAVFFCFFEAIRQLIMKREHQREVLQMQQIRSDSGSSSRRIWKRPARRHQPAAACLTLALPLHRHRLQ